MAASVLLVFSCKKNDNNVSENPKNSWVLNGTVYTATDISRSSPSGATVISATQLRNTSTNSVYFRFIKVPTTTDSVRVGGRSPQMVITTSTSAGGISYTTETVDSTRKALVTVTKNKLTITVPEIWMKNISNIQDSVRFYCFDIMEP